jgi:hypothetical protein
MTEEINFMEICDLTTNVMGLPNGSLSLKSRKRKLQACRSVAAYIALTEEDINRNIIARTLNRDRTATYHYERSHEKNFKHCIIYRTAFDKIYKAYKDFDSEKDIFVNKRQMKNHLLQNGVTESIKSDVILEVKSGQIICNINTSYFDFSNQLENIKFAMENYHYTIKII